MGFFDSKTQTVRQDPLLTDFQLKIGKQLADYIGTNLPSYTPGEAYSGPLSVTDPSSYEQTGLGVLGRVLGKSPVGSVFGAGQDEIMKTLKGFYSDPRKSPYIQAATDLAKQNLGDAISEARGRAGARNNFFSTSALQEESRLSERTQNYLNSVIGDFLNSERARQFSAAPIAQQFDQYSNLTAPLAQVNASQTYGALPRTLQQADYERQYQDFTRQRSELSGVPSAAQQLFSTQVPFGVREISKKSPSTFMSMWGEVNPFVGSYNTHQYGYNTNQTSISDAVQLMARIYGAGGI